MAIKFIENITENRQLFENKVISISRLLGVDPDWLMIIFNSETGGTFSPSVRNKVTGAVGLIQFMPATCCGLLGKLSKSQSKDRTLRKYYAEKMGALKNYEQLEYVYQYFKAYTGKITDLYHLYLIAFYPNADGVFGGTLYKPNNWKFPKKISEGNRGIDNENGDITISSFKRWVDKKSKITLKSSTVQKTEQKKQKEVSQRIEEQKQVDSVVIPLTKGNIVYIHTNPLYTTLDEIIQYKGWYDYLNKKELTADKILNFGTPATNRQSIRKAYGEEKLDKNGNKIEDGQEANYVPLGARIEISGAWILPEFVPFDGSTNIFPNKNTKTFILNALKRSVVTKTFKKKFNTQTSVVLKRQQKPKVLIWCKAVNVKKGQSSARPRYDVQGELLDISPFIQNLVVNNTKNGASFSFTLPPITMSYENDFSLKVLPKGYKEVNRQGGYVFKGNTHRDVNVNGEDLKMQNIFYFHNMISANDVVFISFNDDNIFDKETNTVSPDEPYNIVYPTEKLSQNSFSLIGLVDTNTVSTQGQDASGGVSITGRDLNKLIIEDSTQLLNIGREVRQQTGIFRNDNPENWGRPALASKLNMNTELLSASYSKERTVGEMVSFIFNSLVTTEICNGNLFLSYLGVKDDFRISQYDFFNYESRKIERYDAAGIWKIVKVISDPDNVQDRYVRDTTIAVHSGSIMNGIKTMVDDRFVELLSDTYINNFFFLIRRPPFNESDVKSYLDELTSNSEALNITADKVVSTNLGWYSGDVYSWYRMNTDYVSYGKQQFSYLEEMPAVFFREFCEVYGNKGLDVQNIYTPFAGINPKREEQEKYGADKTRTERQIFEDLSFLIETNAYLPFTRSGTFTVIGDERIRKGVWMRSKTTGEVFYIDGVNHNYSVNEKQTNYTTTISVSRGMVEYNASGQYILPLYFNIISGLHSSEKQLSTKRTIPTDTVEDSKLLFDTNESSLLDPTRDLSLLNKLDERNQNVRLEISYKNLSIIDKYVNKLRNDSSLSIRVTGYTDERSSVSYNKDLGSRRAHHVVSIIKETYNRSFPELPPLGNDRISVYTFGEKVAADLDNLLSDKQNLSKNDRAVIVKLTYQNSEGVQQVVETYQDNYSKLKVNQEIFSFFLSRRQFSDNILDFETLGNYSISNQPNLGEIIEVNELESNIIKLDRAERELEIWRNGDDE
jgi:hypothetical protein